MSESDATFQMHVQEDPPANNPPIVVANDFISNIPDVCMRLVLEYLNPFDRLKHRATSTQFKRVVDAMPTVPQLDICTNFVDDDSRFLLFSRRSKNFKYSYIREAILTNMPRRQLLATSLGAFRPIRVRIFRADEKVVNHVATGVGMTVRHLVLDRACSCVVPAVTAAPVLRRLVRFHLKLCRRRRHERDSMHGPMSQVIFREKQWEVVETITNLAFLASFASHPNLRDLKLILSDSIFADVYPGPSTVKSLLLAISGISKLEKLSVNCLFDFRALALDCKQDVSAMKIVHDAFAVLVTNLVHLKELSVLQYPSATFWCDIKDWCSKTPMIASSSLRTLGVVLSRSQALDDMEELARTCNEIFPELRELQLQFVMGYHVNYQEMQRDVRRMANALSSLKDHPCLSSIVWTVNSGTTTSSASQQFNIVFNEEALFGDHIRITETQQDILSDLV